MLATFPEDYPGTAARCPNSSPACTHFMDATPPQRASRTVTQISGDRADGDSVSPMTAPVPLRMTTVRANDLDFGLLEAGSGPLALCLHGFPDTAHTWKHLLPALADAGFHAVAPFMRGYAPTAIPADGAYQIGALVADAVALHEALGGDGDAVLIGHDWGAETAYGAAA